jgi:acid phosphatase (class A)
MKSSMKQHLLALYLLAWCAGVSADPIYLLPSDADMLHLLAPPPVADSTLEREDLRAVIEAQHSARSAGTLPHAEADAELTCARVGDVLGDATVMTRDPQLLTFLNEAAREAATLAGPTKNYWKRTRPFAASNEVEALADMASAKTVAPAKDETRSIDVGASGMSGSLTDVAHSSYPSGHSAFGTVCAILLADMVPERRAALFARALDYAHSRMVVGAHFPTDLEAGRLTGTVAAELLMRNPRFQHDFAIERASLRATLALPLQPAD